MSIAMIRASRFLTVARRCGRSVKPIPSTHATGGGAFHVVAISLPGSASPSGRTRPGYGQDRDARIIAMLMARLGYTRYAVQGGDVGAFIGRLLALNDARTSSDCT